MIIIINDNYDQENLEIRMDPCAWRKAKVIVRLNLGGMIKMLRVILFLTLSIVSVALPSTAYRDASGSNRVEFGPGSYYSFYFRNDFWHIEYLITDKKCATGVHEFEGTKLQAFKNAFATLNDDSKNNHCGAKLRAGIVDLLQLSEKYEM